MGMFYFLSAGFQLCIKTDIWEYVNIRFFCMHAFGFNVKDEVMEVELSL